MVGQLGNTEEPAAASNLLSNIGAISSMKFGLSKKPAEEPKNGTQLSNLEFE